nr:MAG TPA: hypothetical protein [Caudoviricetes sp.]
MPNSMPNSHFNTSLANIRPMQFYLFSNFGLLKPSFHLNALNTLSFLIKYFYIIIIWNIFAKETSK